MMTTTSLRDYQALCVSLTLQKIEVSAERGFHYVLPTGTGKTEVAQEIAREKSKLGRVLCVAHTRDLIRQTANRFSQTLSDVGICMAEENDITSRIVVGSIQTLNRGRFQAWLSIGEKPSLVWIDECHHVTAENRYGALLKELWASFPDVPVVGCTATDFRTDGRSMQKLLPVCTFSRTIADMQQAQWLAPTVWTPVMLPMNLQDVGKSRSNGDTDYNEEELATALLPHTEQVVKKTIPIIGERKTIVFCATVKHAQEVARCYLDHDVTAACVWGDMPRERRRHVLEGWREGTFQLVTNVGVLTEGFDLPDIAAMVGIRPTLSPGRYLQMLGRCTRLKSGPYKDALIIDVCDNTNLLDTNQVSLPKVQGCHIPETEHGTAKELVELLELEEEQAKRVAHVQKPRSVLLGAWENVTWARWGWDKETNCYYLGFGQNGQLGEYYIAILPDLEGSGLWYPFMFSYANHKWKREKIVDYPVKLNQAMQHINQLIAQNGMKKALSKNASWQMECASAKQLYFLGQLDEQAGQQARESRWTKGEVSLAITWEKLRRPIWKTLGKL